VRKQIILLALCLVGVLVSVSCVTAADIYVNASAPAGGDGSSTNPFQNISSGVNLATDGDTVNIADGTYTGDSNTGITISKNMSIIGQSQTGTIIDAENNNWIFKIADSVTVSISKLTLKNSATTEDDYGAIYNNGDAVTFNSCAFTTNQASVRGGAIYNYGDLVTFNNCAFTGNTAESGGAIYNRYGVVTFNSCAFTDNSASGSGGAIYNYGDLLTFNSCAFTGNTAAYGGGIYNRDELICTNCDFTGNTAAYSGGAIYNDYATVTVIGSNLASNTAGNDGGAFNNYFGDFTLNFNWIVGNTAGRYGPDIYNTNNPENTINALYNWWGSNDGPAAGSIEYSQEDLVEYDPWLVMTYSADPTTIQQGETSTLTADFRYDSDGTFHDPAGGHLPDGLPVTFTTDLGNVGSKSVVTYTLNGVATATLRGDEAAGEALTTANLDDQTLTAPVTIRAAGGEDDGNSTVIAEAATSETVGMQETGTPISGIVLAILMVLGGFISTRKNNKR